MEKNFFEKRVFGSLTLGTLLGVVASVVAFAAISWIYFYPSDVRGDQLRQNDVLQGAANGHEAQLYDEAHRDTGEVTRWTNSLFGGMPTFQIAPYYPSNAFINKLGRVLTLGFPEPVSWIFMLMLGFFILMLAFDMKWYLAVLGAIGYAFSSYFFIIIDAGHIWKLLTLCYIPPTIAGIVWAYRGKYLLGGAVAAFFATLQLISNHVQMTYYSLFIIVPLVVAYLVQAIVQKKLGGWLIATGTLAVAAALALGANASNLYLSYKYSKETMRGGHSELTPLPGDNDAQASNEPTAGGLSKEYITQWSYGIDETWTLMVPNVKGGTSNHSLAETSKADDLQYSGDLSGQEAQAMQVFPQYFGDQPFTSGPVYVGALIFALFFVGLIVVKGPVKWALLFATVLTVILSWGHNAMWLTDFFIDHFPMYNKFRTVSSILVVAELTMPLLAALAVKEMLTRDDFFDRYGKVVYGVFGACAALCLLFAVMPGLFGGGATEADAQRFAMATGGQGTLSQFPGIESAMAVIRRSLVSADAWRSLFILVLGFAVIFTFKLRKLPAVAATLIIAAIVLVDMYAVNKRYLNEECFVDADEIPATTFTERSADTQILRDKSNYRVLDINNFANPMPSYFHKTVGGYHAAKLTRYNDLIERQLSKSNQAVFNMLNTKYVIIDDNTVQQNPGALGNAWFVDTLTYVKNADAEMQFLDDFNPATTAVADAQFRDVLGEAKAVTPGDTIAETAYEPNRLTYKTKSAAGGLAVFSEIYFPWGWTATIDGKPSPIGRVNYVLRAMQVPAGEHTVVFTFDPQEVHQTETVATTSVYIILFLLGLTLAYYAYRSLRSRKTE